MAKHNQGPAQPLGRIVANDALLAAWHQRMQLEAQLTTTVRRLVPRALAPRMHVMEATPPLLHLAVAAGAVAAVLRQRSPAILAALRREGWDFTEMRVHVQVTPHRSEKEKTVKQQRDKVDIAPLQQLGRTLPDGPLKRAVERLLRRTT